MKNRVRIRKSEEAATVDSPPTNRLTAITVNEVSIVDRAANQRKYLVVKEAAAQPGVPPPAAPPAVAPPPPAPPVAQLRISPELKMKIGTILKAAQEKIVAIAKALETAAETPGAPPPQELIDALTGLSGMFAAPAAPAPAQPAPAPAPVAAPAMKAGKKISAARLALLTSAQASLKTIIDEVTAAGADDDETEEPSTPAKTGKSDPLAEPLVATPPDPQLGALQTQLDSLAGLVGKMTLVFETQNQRIAEVTKSVRGESRQVELDKGSAKPQRVVWDLDMAKPMKTVQ
jgi:hypothetical protein